MQLPELEDNTKTEKLESLIFLKSKLMKKLGQLIIHECFEIQQNCKNKMFP